MRSNKEKSIFGVYWMGIMSVGNVVIKLLIMMVLSRLIKPAEFGIVAAVQVVISFAQIFWMMGVGPAIVQKKCLSISDIHTGNTLNIIFGISVYTAIFLFTPYIANFVGIESMYMLRVLSLVFVIHSLSGVSESLLQKEMEFKTIGMIDLISLILYGLFAIILAILGFGAWSLVIAQLIQVVSKTLFSIIKMPIGISIKVNKASAKELIYYGTGFTLSRVFNQFATQGDYFVVNRTLGSTFLGFYNRAYQLLLAPTNVIGSVIDKVLFPLLSKYQDNYKKIRYVFFNITALIALISLPITIVSIILGTDLVNFVLGPDWDNTVLPFKILVISLFFRMAYKICDSLVRSLGAVYKRLWVQILYAVLVIGGAFIGKEWGINGVAISTSIAILINYLVMTLLIKTLIKFKIVALIKYLLPIFVVSVIVSGLSYIISISLRSFSIVFVRLTILTISTGILYLLSFKYIIIKMMPEDFKEFVSTVLEVTLNKLPSSKMKNKILKLFI